MGSELLCRVLSLSINLEPFHSINKNIYLASYITGNVKVFYVFFHLIH